MHNDSQQSRLACTVIADESCLFAVFYMETGILENDFGAVNVDMLLLQDLMGDNCELEMIFSPKDLQIF